MERTRPGLDLLVEESREHLTASVFDRALKCIEENYCSESCELGKCPKVCKKQFELALKFMEVLLPKLVELN